MKRRSDLIRQVFVTYNSLLLIPPRPRVAVKVTPANTRRIMTCFESSTTGFAWPSRRKRLHLCLGAPAISGLKVKGGLRFWRGMYPAMGEGPLDGYCEHDGRTFKGNVSGSNSIGRLASSNATSSNATNSRLDPRSTQIRQRNRHLPGCHPCIAIDPVQEILSVDVIMPVEPPLRGTVTSHRPDPRRDRRFRQNQFLTVIDRRGTADSAS